MLSDFRLSSQPSRSLRPDSMAIVNLRPQPLGDDHAYGIDAEKGEFAGRYGGKCEDNEERKYDADGEATILPHDVLRRVDRS